MSDKRLSRKTGVSIIATLLCVLLFLLLFAPSVSATTLGDVDSSGAINVADVVLVQKEILKKTPGLTAAQKLLADVNGDGVVTINDAVLIMKRAVGLISSFPLPPTVTSLPFTTISTNNTVVITLTGGTFKAGTITAADFTFAGDNKVTLEGGTFTRTSDTVVTITGLTLVTATNNTVHVKAATMATKASSVTAVASTSVLQVLSVIASPTAGGTVTGGGTFAPGAVVPITATANTGYTFSNWTATAGTFVYANTVSPNYYNMPAASAAVYANFIATNGVTISTSKTTPGVSFKSGAFTSGEVVPAPASAVYAGYTDVITVADGIEVTLTWVTNSALNNVITVNGALATAAASVYVYAENSAQNTASIITNAIRSVKDHSGYITTYSGLLKATVSSATKKVNISGIEETAGAPAATVNLWKFVVGTPTPGSFTVYQHNKTVADQVNNIVAGAVYHVDARKAVFKITVTNGATASGNLVVNVKDTLNAIDVDVSVPVINGNSVNEVASRIYSAISGNSIVAANYVYAVTGADVTLTQKTGKVENISVTLK